MSQIIAGLYELKTEIGSGGGGIVYLGRHIRLDKEIVLKADKRSLTVGTDVLRREVDMLKGLSQTYIPQVYDFVQENDTVYTVMDYIRGESLNRILDRSGKQPQARVIRWACQLLEALEYLHGRPPHGILHGDIKPANIMLRPDGSICLIDFNIALALGESGAVKVGFSRGYASPEHYGIEYADAGRRVRYLAQEGTETVTMAASSTGGTGRGRGSVLLDVRSDIYSLGATLYHLISGRKPAQDALLVEGLTGQDCSPAVADIIRRAMSPLPKDRYQTAAQMREALFNLHRTDRRAQRRRRGIFVSAAVWSSLFLVGGICSFVGLKQLEQRQTALALAEYSANALARGEVNDAISLALQAVPRGGILEAPVTAQAQRALTDALGVYDLSDGFKALDSIALPGPCLDLSLSPEGRRLAAVYGYEAAVYDLETGDRLVALPLWESAWSDCLFTDEDHVAFAGKDGVSLYDLARREVLWTGEPASLLAVSGDGSAVAAARDGEGVVVYRASDGSRLTERSFEGRRMGKTENDRFADPKDYVFALNEDGSLLAASFADGTLTVFDLEDRESDLLIYEGSDYRIFEGGFCGAYFAYAAYGESGSFGLVDTEQGVLRGGLETEGRFLLQADERGIFLGQGGTIVEIDPAALEEREAAYTGGPGVTNFAAGGGYVLAATEDNGVSFYDREGV